MAFELPIQIGINCYMHRLPAVSSLSDRAQHAPEPKVQNSLPKARAAASKLSSDLMQEFSSTRDSPPEWERAFPNIVKRMLGQRKLTNTYI